MPAIARHLLRRRERALGACDPVMARLIGAAGRCTMELRAERPVFEALASAIAHQQLNGLVARRILARFTALYAPAEFPQPEAVIATGDEALRAVGFSYAKIRALRDLADKVVGGVVPAAEELQQLGDEAIIGRLTQVRGIGRWTVEMMLMFRLGRPDVLPVDDFGVRNGFRLAYGLKAMPTPRALAQFGARWAPNRSMAAWYLWRAVELAREQKLPRVGRPPRLALQKARGGRERPGQPQAARRGKRVARGKRVGRWKLSRRPSGARRPAPAGARRR